MLAIIILISGILLLFFSINSETPRKKVKTTKPNSKPAGCKKAHTGLLPVMNPLYNVREICKQSLLLEDHLFQKKKQCMDCCRKHALTLEALAEEAITLDKDQKYSEILDPLPNEYREISKQLIDKEDSKVIAQNLRKIRKELVPLCFDQFN